MLGLSQAKALVRVRGLKAAQEAAQRYKDKDPAYGGRVLHTYQTLTVLSNSTNDDTANNGDASEDGRNTRIRKGPSSNPMGSNRKRMGSNRAHNNNPAHSRRDQEFRC
jgi:hypothetical protein